MREPSGRIHYNQGQDHPEADLEVCRIAIPATEGAIQKVIDLEVPPEGTILVNPETPK